MALSTLRTTMLRVALASDAEAGLRKVSMAMGTMPATHPCPGRFLPGLAVIEPRPAWVGTDDLGTAQAVVRAGRPQSLAGAPCTANLRPANIGRNPRGTNLSSWSRPFQCASRFSSYHRKASAVQG